MVRNRKKETLQGFASKSPMYPDNTKVLPAASKETNFIKTFKSKLPEKYNFYHFDKSKLQEIKRYFPLFFHKCAIKLLFKSNLNLKLE